MKSAYSLFLRLSLGLLMLAGLCVALEGQARPAHAQSALTVTDCSSESQLQADVTQANSDNAGDIITFACSGDIKLTSTLTLSGSMTLDGSGQMVTLDGQNTVRVLAVQNGVSFTLNALTVAHGLAGPYLDNYRDPIYEGGGLLNYGGTVTITNSTFASNAASAAGTLWPIGGGGLANEYGGTLNISNSTFVGNSTSGYDALGGAITAGLDGCDFSVNISNSTFVGNSASGPNSAFGGLNDNCSSITIYGSIVANNTEGNCSNLPYDNPIDLGYNLESGTDCGFTATGSVQNADPLLAALASNGGPTQTLALQQGSPAIDAMPLSANLCPSTDQRGVSRPDNGESACDMGAYEFTDPPDKDLGLSGLPGTITVDATGPQGVVVTYTAPTATDESGDSPAPAVSCTSASGSTFAIGTTTVTCTATDGDDTNSPVSGNFQVVVKGAAAQVSDLVNTVNSFHLASSLQNALDTKLNEALKAINGGQAATACSDLSDFIGQVQAKIGKGITSGQATKLSAAAKQVQAVLGC